jgi:ferredoxin-NAD(P)+ reductase (naphthalene dioxygenase ferredoxin-specific)
MTYRVTVGNTGQTIDCAAGQTILTAAVLAGIAYPYGCASGNCSQCISRLESGTVDLLPHGDGALGRRQKAAGLTLACRAEPRSDVAITWLAKSALAG